MDTVRIRLRKPNRVVRFLCSNVTIERGERCVARSERGLEYGVCVAPPQHCPDEIARQINAKVIRKATEEDETAFQRLVEEEAGAQQVCLEMIRERDLPMKVVETEFTFDRKRVCFYFTADQRVDFRQLVRDLAHRLHMRIELRHIQVRDQAKMVGGIGECGRVLCCQGWLRDFMPISMKMAKRQNLSLNPDKISGQCGRLMCCLSYENDQYEDKKKRKEAPHERNPDKCTACPAAPEAVSLEPETASVSAEPLREAKPSKPALAEATPAGRPQDLPEAMDVRGGTPDAGAQEQTGSETASGRRSRRRRKRGRKPDAGPSNAGNRRGGS